MLNQSQKLVMGIDPGIKGAIALYDLSSHSLVLVNDLPTKCLQRSLKGRSTVSIDCYDLSLLIERWNSESQITHCIIEDVHSMPRDGGVQAFSFGKTTGQIIGVVSAAMIPIIPVRPVVWKSLMGLSHDKNLSRQLAIKYFPLWEECFKRKKDDGRAEAALLSLFGAQRFT